jgi:hypothetical protein
LRRLTPIILSPPPKSFFGISWLNLTNAGLEDLKFLLLFHRFFSSSRHSRHCYVAQRIVSKVMEAACSEDAEWIGRSPGREVRTYVFLVFSKRRRRFADEIWRETAETRSLFGADGEREQIDSSADKVVIENDWVNWKSIVLHTKITPARAVSD